MRIEYVCEEIVSLTHEVGKFDIKQKTGCLSRNAANRVAMYVANYGITHSKWSLIFGALSFLEFRNEQVLIFANASAFHCPHLTVGIIKSFCDEFSIAHPELVLSAQSCLRRANREGMMQVHIEEAIRCIECLDCNVKASEPSDARTLIENALWQITDGEKSGGLISNEVRSLTHELRQFVPDAEDWEVIKINAHALSGCVSCRK